MLLSPPPHSLLEQDSQKVKHKLSPLIGPFPSQLHSWAALGASIWEGSSARFTKSCNRPSHWQQRPPLPFSLRQPLFCSELCPSNHELAVQRVVWFWGSLLLGSGLAQPGICPGFAPASRSRGQYRLHCLLPGHLVSAPPASFLRNRPESPQSYQTEWRLGPTIVWSFPGV